MWDEINANSHRIIITVLAEHLLCARNGPRYFIDSVS